MLTHEQFIKVLKICKSYNEWRVYLASSNNKKRERRSI